jgi:hypothetical protein
MYQKNIKFLEQSPVKMNFTKKIMTAYGGFAVMAKLFEKVKLKESIEDIVPFDELSPNSTGVFAKVLRFGLTVLAGGKRFSHSMFLGDSLEIYQLEFGVERLPKSISAVTRFFGKFCSWQKAEQFAAKLWEYIFSVIISANIKEDYVSFDSSVVTRYGHQEGAEKGYNPKKKGRPSHHPLIAFLNRSKYIVNLWNRSGNTSSGNNAVDFIKQTIERVRAKIKIKGCLADSGFYLIELIKYLESEVIEYVIAARLLRPLQQEIAKIESWHRVADNIDIAELVYQHQDSKWDKPRRYIVIRQTIVVGQEPPQGRQLTLFKEDKDLSKYRFGVYITSSTAAAEDVWRTYRLRADDENIIKEQKQDFGFEGFATDSFYATEAAMLFQALFYNLIQLFRSTILTEEEAKQTLHTLRMKYLIIPAVLGNDGKEPILRLGVRDRSLQQKLLWIIERIDQVFNERIAFTAVNG